VGSIKVKLYKIINGSYILIFSYFCNILGEGMDLGCASNVTVGLIGTQAV
jgi:hypothetical protein